MLHCKKCGDSTYALMEGGVCASCACLVIPPTVELEKKPRKPKSKHKLEQNILTYLIYVVEHPELETIQKKDMHNLMGISYTATNYLIKVLKERGFIITIGKPGAQKLKPVRLFRDCILARLLNIKECVDAYMLEDEE